MQSAAERTSLISRALARVRSSVRSIDDEAAVERKTLGERYDRGPAVACIVAALALVFMEYASERDLLRFVYAHDPSLYDPRFAQLAELSAWVLVRLVAFFVLPALVIRFVLRQRIVDHGLRLRGLSRHWAA